jgi:predicted DCC family thiol-disulfide oxidoreductase YuxK
MFGRIDPRQYAAIRIAVGFMALLTILGLIGYSDFHFSDAGWLPLRLALETTNASEWTLLHSFTSTTTVRLFFVGAVLSSLCLITGFRSRLFAWLTFAMVVSIQSRNWTLTYGGDAAVRVMLFYVALSDCGRKWSIDAWLARRRSPGNRTPTAGAAAWPRTLMQIQVCLIYLTSGLAKLHGHDWVTDGSAMSAVLMNPTFARYDFSFLLAGRFWPKVLGAISRMVVLWELLFSALILNRWTRMFALFGGVLIHLGITFTLQVHWFGYVMVLTYLAFLQDRTFLRAEVVARRWLWRGLRQDAIRVVYTGDCAFCRRSAETLRSLDTRSKIQLVAVDANSPAGDLPRRFNRAELHRQMFVVIDGQRQLSGGPALGAIGECSTTLLPLKWVLRLPGAFAILRAAHAVGKERKAAASS